MSQIQQRAYKYAYREFINLKQYNYKHPPYIGSTRGLSALILWTITGPAFYFFVIYLYQSPLHLTTISFLKMENKVKLA